jgi:hypothetical protein
MVISFVWMSGYFLREDLCVRRHGHLCIVGMVADAGSGMSQCCGFAWRLKGRIDCWTSGFSIRLTCLNGRVFK